MTREELGEHFKLADEREEKRYAFLRQLLLLASGALTALVAFRTGSSTGLALAAMQTAWVALGLGILLGASAIHGEVWLAAERVRLNLAQAKQRKSLGGAPLSPSVAILPWRYKAARRICYASLLVAVVALVTHALAR